jgi:hypothetical protein
MLESTLQFVGRAIDGFAECRGLMMNDNRRHSADARFHDATFVIVASLVCVLVTEMNLDTGDARGEAAHRVDDDGLDALRDGLRAVNVVIGIDQDLHDVPLYRPEA